MKCYQRAIRYLWRKKAKTGILLLILMVSSSMILCTVIILRASENARNEIKEKTKTNLMLEIVEKNSLLSDAEIDEVEQLSGVQSLNRIGRMTAYPVGFQVITQSEESAEINFQIQIHGYDSLEEDGPFAELQLRLSEGSYPDADNQMVVNKKLAEYNQWSVGDDIELEGGNGRKVTGNIIGIYYSGLEDKQGKNAVAVHRIENQVYAKPEFLHEFEETSGYEKVSVYLTVPERLTEIEKEITEILGEKVAITKSDTLYQQMKFPLDQMAQVVKMMLALTIGAAEIVVTLLLCMWMRSRKKETAVYISLGKSKVSVFMQVVLEAGLVFLTAVLLALGFGSMAAELLKNIILSDMENTVNLQLGLKGIDIGILVIAGGSIVIMAVAISLIPALIANPKDILSEMEG